MDYPKEFIEKAKRLFPDWQDFHEKLDAGREIVGRYLDDSCSQSISVDRILQTTKIEILHEEAKNLKEKLYLYREWNELYQQQYGGNN